MRITAGLVITTFLAFTATTTAPMANPDEEAVAGALVLLGIAALAHNEHHYRDGYAPQNTAQTADFERGYRDGLHGYDYDSAHSSVDYGHGYDAGHAERANRRVSQRQESEGPNVPPIAMQGCAKTVATNFGVGTHDVHITRTVQRGPNDFLVEAAVGHDYMTCVMGDGGQVVEVTGGRMQ